MPANRNPLKTMKIQTSAKHRLAMLDLVLKKEPQMGYSDMEITRGGPSYTIDTMSELLAVRPAEYWFLMGADALKGFTDWKNPAKLVKMCRLAVAMRPPTSQFELMARIPEEYRSQIDVIQMASSEISSTELRDRISQGQPVNHWISPEVLQYAQANKLYQLA